MSRHSRDLHHSPRLSVSTVPFPWLRNNLKRTKLFRLRNIDGFRKVTLFHFAEIARNASFGAEACAVVRFSRMRPGIPKHWVMCLCCWSSSDLRLLRALGASLPLRTRRSMCTQRERKYLSTCNAKTGLPTRRGTCTRIEGRECANVRAIRLDVCLLSVSFPPLYLCNVSLFILPFKFFFFFSFFSFACSFFVSAACLLILFR